MVRLFHLYPPSTQQGDPPSNPLSTRSIMRHAWSTICAILYTCHIAYLTFSEDFDYGFNMLVNVVVGAIHNVLWVLYSIPKTPFRRYPYSSSSFNLSSHLRSSNSSTGRWMSKPLKCIVVMTAAMLLELFDFPPWYRVIDAHSLWHLATVPIAGMWYDFLVEDARDDGWVLHKLQ